MGAKESKSNEIYDTRLVEEERQILKEFFLKIANGKQVVPKDALTNEWMKAGSLEESLLRKVIEVLSTSKQNAPEGVPFTEFVNLFAFIVHGNLDEKASALASLISNTVNCAEIHKYISQIVVSYVNVLLKAKEYQTWKSALSTAPDDSVGRVARATLHDLAFRGKLPKDTLGLALPYAEEYSRDDLAAWLMVCPQFSIMQSAVFQCAYGVKIPPENNLLPVCVDLKGNSCVSLLDCATISYLNSFLANELRSQWRFLFSTKVHGESFSKMLGCVTDRGPTVIVIEDKGGDVFGCFASHSWTISSQFYGNSSCFLFHIVPQLAVYASTGYNNHYMYLNTQQQTMPNGLAMGGQMGYFGLFLDANFGSGHCTPACSTFRSPVLSKEAVFEINHIEVWGVGPPPVKDEDERNSRSVLDGHQEAKAVLTMAGKFGHSDGIREEPQDS